MKKTAIFFVSSLFAATALSQHHIGIKAGPAFSTPSHSPVTWAGSLDLQGKPFWGWQAGAFYKIGIARGWQISLEPGFLTTGSREKYLTEEQILNRDFKNHYDTRKAGYIEVPLYIQYSIRRFYLSAGPGISCKIFSRVQGLENRRFTFPFYKTFDAGANILAGYQVLRNTDIDIRAYQGFANVEKMGPYKQTRNQVWSLVLCYTFNNHSKVWQKGS